MAASVRLLLLLLLRLLARPGVPAASSSTATRPREEVNFDLAWRFQAVPGSSAWPPADPPSCEFGPLPDPQGCSKSTGAPRGNAFASYNQINSAEECQAQCCAMEECRDWMWTPAVRSGTKHSGGCIAGVCAPSSRPEGTADDDAPALPAGAASGRKLPSPPPPPSAATVNASSPGGSHYDDAACKFTSKSAVACEFGSILTVFL